MPDDDESPRRRDETDDALDKSDAYWTKLGEHLRRADKANDN